MGRGSRVLLAQVAAVVSLLLACTAEAPPEVLDQTERFGRSIELPTARVTGSVSLEETLRARRSVREFGAGALPIETVGQLLWAGQGVTDDEGHRTAPSAGARYPIELYTVTSDEVGQYRPDSHRLDTRADPRAGPMLADLAFGQQFVSEAPLVIVVAAVPERTAAEYGAVAEALVDREAGHVAQNILLQATALDLAAVPVGGFDPSAVAEVLALPPGWDVRYLIPVGETVGDRADS